MRANEFINEEWIVRTTGYRNKEVDIFANPTPSEIVKTLKSTEVDFKVRSCRWIANTTRKTFFIFPAYLMHQMAFRKLTSTGDVSPQDTSLFGEANDKGGQLTAMANTVYTNKYHDVKLKDLVINNNSWLSKYMYIDEKMF